MSLKVLLYKSLDHILAVMFDVYVHEIKNILFCLWGYRFSGAAMQCAEK